MIQKVNYGKKQFQVEVEFLERKRLSITVHPNLKVTAKAPKQYNKEIVQKRIQKKASWIAKQLRFFEQYHPPQPERRYVSGETHYYLGRQYRLRIKSGQSSQVRLKGRFFEVELPHAKDNDKVKNLMLKWYNSHSHDWLTKRIDQHLDDFLKLGFQEPEIRYRRMKKRWGSCSGNGRIVLNTDLIKAPIHCIDYVIIHELCHLRFPHHDKKFYALLSRLLPDWERRKERLERVMI